MALYLRGTTWWCRWTVGGQTLRESSGSANRREAQEYHDRRRADLWRSERLGEHRVSWDQAALAWVEEHARHKRSYGNDLLKLRWLTPRLTGRAITDITPELMMQLREAKIAEGWTGATANRHLATVSAVLPLDAVPVVVARTPSPAGCACKTAHER